MDDDDEYVIFPNRDEQWARDCDLWLEARDTAEKAAERERIWQQVLSLNRSSK